MDLSLVRLAVFQILKLKEAKYIAVFLRNEKTRGCHIALPGPQYC